MSSIFKRTRTKKNLILFLLGFVLASSVVSIAALKIADRNDGAVILRIDDIQDFAFKDAQIFLINEGLNNKIPATLGIIAGAFGQDNDIVQIVKQAVSSGSDVAAHGWKHEDLARLSVREQAALLFQSTTRIKETVGLETKMLAPPMYRYNDDTIAAMKVQGYEVLSSFAGLPVPNRISEVTDISATVELSMLSGDIWNMKTIDALEKEVAQSIIDYGFAVILIHPQEFLVDARLDESRTELYRVLLTELKTRYSFVTMGELCEKLK